jgi:hypothetical protein
VPTTSLDSYLLRTTQIKIKNLSSFSLSLIIFSIPFRQKDKNSHLFLFPGENTNGHEWLERGKTKTTAKTTRITKFSTVLLTSSLLVLSSIAAAQLLLISTNNNSNVAFAAEKCKPPTETDGTLETACSGGGGAAGGGGGGHSTCTIDISTGIGTCTHAFGHGAPSGGTGGRETCIGLIGGEDDLACSGTGGSGSKPQ